MLELLRELWASPGTLYHPRAWQEGSVPGQRNGVSRDCFQPEGISEEAFLFSVLLVTVVFGFLNLFVSSPAYLQ